MLRLAIVGRRRSENVPNETKSSHTNGLEIRVPITELDKSA